MSDSSPAQSKIDLLKNLNSRVKPASEHFAENSAASSRKSRAAPLLTELLPDSERFEFKGMSCVRIQSRARLDGARTRQGYACPALASDPCGTEQLRINLANALTLLHPRKDPDPTPTDPADVLFIDTETTSLSAGAGAVAFLVGVGRFHFAAPTPEFVVTQYFMEDYPQEEAMIEALVAEFENARALASYNGRSFDVPILESRWRMHRRQPRFPHRHFDLLHPARRLWKRRLNDCRLGTVERQLLGLVRFSDIESALVSRVFNDYTRSIHPARMLQVLDHHAQDIFSLGALLAHLARGLNDPTRSEFAQAEDQWGLARIFQQSDQGELAIQCLERAAVCARDEEFGFRLAMHLGRRLMRLGRTQDALDIFTARATHPRGNKIDPHIELAKYHEHKLRDFAEAGRWTELALGLVEAVSPGAGTDKLLEELAKRRNRLLQRLSSASPPEA